MPHYLSIITLSLFLVACSNNEKIETPADVAEQETNLSSQKAKDVSQLSEEGIEILWKGKNAKELVKKYGQPDTIINATIRGGPASEGYVYEGHRMAGNTSCMNVYVVGMTNDTILRYFCR